MFKRLERDAREREASAMGSVTGFYRFDVGEHEVTVIHDGTMGVSLPFLATNAPEDDVRALMREHGLGTEFVALPVGNVLVRTGDRLVLLDTGIGTSDFATALLGDYVGGLVPTLELIGVSPEAITDVIFSHSHVDHLGGTSIEGRLSFPNAQHFLPTLEWAYLQRDDVPAPIAPFIEFAKRQLRPVVEAGRMSSYGDGDELVPGIRAIEALGHSAGHHALLIESRDQRLLLPFDVLGHPILHLRHPEWIMAPDAPVVAVETRRRLLARAADEQIPVLAHHFPFPGLGLVTRDGDAYRYQPTSH
jgi:glyoxylase-like metal-dependent hydrolase (beta-lactamase superfamily II)